MRSLAASIACCALLFGAAQASAQSVAREHLGVSGSAPQTCAIANGRFRTGELVNFIGSDSDTLRVIELLDPRDLSVQSARATVSFEAFCSFPHRVRLESQENGLWPISGPVAPTSTAFATALPYQVSLTWADRTQTVEYDAKLRRSRIAVSDINQPAAGEIVVGVELDRGASNTLTGAPLLAGAYSDTLRIYLEPR